MFKSALELEEFLAKMDKKQVRRERRSPREGGTPRAGGEQGSAVRGGLRDLAWKIWGTG